MSLKLVPIVSDDQKSHIAPYPDHLRLAKATVPLVIPLALHDAGASGIIWPKCHVAPHFNCLYLRNAVVSFMMLSASCGASARPGGVTWPKWHIAPHFDCLHLKDVVSLAMLLALCTTNVSASGITRPIYTCVCMKLCNVYVCIYIYAKIHTLICAYRFIHADSCMSAYIHT